MNLISDYYKDVLEKEHTKGNWGVASLHYAPRVASMMKRYGLTEVLDYGAGAGNLEKELARLLPDVKVFNYDPGVPKWNSRPEPCKMVACIDVIEHIEPELLDNVLDDLQRVILDHAFISISTTPARRILNNGWNAHICIKDPLEWKEIFAKRFTIIRPGMYDGGVEIEVCRKDENI